jgi:hypothetical protein
MIKPAVRIQELKNKLIIIGHELKVNKKINDSLYRKMVEVLHVSIQQHLKTRN